MPDIIRFEGGHSTLPPDEASDDQRPADSAGQPAGGIEGRSGGPASIRINRQWRIVFLWEQGAQEVQILDYH
jgi:hypothetical protein